MSELERDLVLDGIKTTDQLQLLIQLLEGDGLEEEGSEEEVLHSGCGRVVVLYLLAEAKTTLLQKCITLPKMGSN